MLNKNGLLIGIEGIDGAGKTLLCQELQETFIGNDFNILLLKEPSDSPSFGERIRKILSSQDDFSKNELFELFKHDRKLQYDFKIKPALKQGNLVLMDRTFISTACYQDDVESFKDIINYNLERYPVFDRIYILDIPVKKALKRIKKQKKPFERFENKKKLKKAYVNYLNAFALSDEGFDIKLINGMNRFEDIHDEIFQDIVMLWLNKEWINH